MILNVSLVTLYCLDQEKARDFYCENLGFEVAADVTFGEGLKWITLKQPSQPELEVTLMTPGPPLPPKAADVVRAQLEAGAWGGLGLRVDDLRKVYEELSAKGVVFIQEPSERPYGMEAVMRDNTGAWVVLAQRS